MTVMTKTGKQHELKSKMFGEISSRKVDRARRDPSLITLGLTEKVRTQNSGEMAGLPRHRTGGLGENLQEQGTSLTLFGSGGQDVLHVYKPHFNYPIK